MTALIDGMAGGATGDALVASAVGPPATLEPGNPFEAAPPLVSLLSTAVDVTPLLEAQYGPGRWMNGITFEPEGGALDLAGDFPYFWQCPEGITQHAERAWAANSPGGVKQIPTAPAVVLYRPYTAHTADPCITTEGMFGRDARGRAARLLDANLSRIIENELWTGLRSTQAGFGNNFLASTAALTKPNGNTATGFINALADLEEAYTTLDNRPGFIHVQPRIVALWRAFDLIEATPSGRQLVTALGNYVIPGTGYDGSGPGLAAGTHSVSWAYMTGPVAVVRSPTRQQELNDAMVVNRDINDRIIRAEAEVGAFWDGKADVAVKIDHLNELS